MEKWLIYWHLPGESAGKACVDALNQRAEEFFFDQEERFRPELTRIIPKKQ